MLFGRNRTESDRWVAFRSHMGFDAFYCIPGIDGAHEKGGVEGEVGRFRRNHLVPVPVVDTLAELNARLELADRKDDARRIENRVRTVGQDFALEAPLLRPLPADPFDDGLWLTPRVDRYSRVTVRQCHYSVPAKLIGRTVRVSLRASEVVILDGKREVARHPRQIRKSAQSLTLDHYLEVLAVKPGALPGATALAQARASGGVHRRARGVLGLSPRRARRRRRHPRPRRGPAAAPAHGPRRRHRGAGRRGPRRRDLGGRGGVEARKIAEIRGDQPPHPVTDPAPGPRVVSLTERRLAAPAAVIAGLPPDTRPLPSVHPYDELLARRAPATTARPDQPAVTSSEGHPS